MKKARYICIEGTEGVGKSTQTKLLSEYLISKGFKVLTTREPGTEHAPLTLHLRGIMLDNAYDKQLTRPAREFISQAIRSIHLEHVIVPALAEYDFIIQDRGILTGYAYGTACGNSFQDLRNLACQNVDSAAALDQTLPYIPEKIYDTVILLKGSVSAALNRATTSKQEFETGDAMESRGSSFIETAAREMDSYSTLFNTIKIDTDGKTIEQVLTDILSALEIKE